MPNSAIIECVLIDDREEEYDIFNIALKNTGLPVKCRFYSGAAEALVELNNHNGIKPAAIFVDINMPRVNGFEFLKQVSSVERLSTVPVYAYSLSFYPEHRQQALQAGAAGYIIKPATYKQMAQMLSEILSKYRPVNNGC